MLPFEDRYTRQRRLAEIGEAGQRRLLGTRIRVDAGPGSDIEAEYLSRAGVHVTGEQPSDTAFPWQDAFVSQAAGDIARGAWQALRKIREALGQ